jgi:hypothetical protein
MEVKEWDDGKSEFHTHTEVKITVTGQATELYTHADLVLLLLLFFFNSTTARIWAWPSLDFPLPCWSPPSS